MSFVVNHFYCPCVTLAYISLLHAAKFASSEVLELLTQLPLMNAVNILTFLTFLDAHFQSSFFLLIIKTLAAPPYSCVLYAFKIVSKIVCSSLLLKIIGMKHLNRETLIQTQNFFLFFL